MFQTNLPWEPWAKQRPRISKAVKGRPPRTHQPPDDKKAEERTRELLREEWKAATGGAPPLTRNVWVSARFYRSTRQVIDLDNLLKHLLDAATGICWVNDCQVTAYGTVELHLDRTNPRTWLRIGAADAATMLRHYDFETGRALDT